MSVRCGAIPLVLGRVSRLTAILLASGISVSAQQPAGESPITARRAADGHARDAIFDQQHLSESGLAVRDHIQALEKQQGFEYLLGWVLPGDRHRGFRVTADFASTSAAPPATHRPDADQTVAASDTTADPRIVSPAVDLIRLAADVGKTDVLQKSITQSPVESPRDRCDKAALLTLLAIHRGEKDQAAKLLDEFYTLALADEQVLEECRDAVLLCADHASRSPALSMIAREPVQMVTRRYIGEITRKAWHRHLWAVNARLIERAEAPVSGQPTDHNDSSQWHAVSRTTAFEHGSAFPAAQWKVGAGSARNLSSLGDDFLFFASPLCGDFDVETDVTGFGYRDSHLMIGGVWISPIYDHKHYAVGNVRGELERVDLTPAMSDTHSHGSIHYRTRVRDGVATTFFNGRKIHDQTPPSNPDPWLAIRSSYRHDGGVDDLRITGAPTIPTTISMIDSPQLLGWYDYFQTPGSNPNRLADWRGTVFANGSDSGPIAEISSPRASALPAGSFAERLLVYTRPLIEDGTIQYEFWFAPGETVAHPAVGRDCFLLESDAVRLHRLTDGRFERSTLRPGNKTAGHTEDASPHWMPAHWMPAHWIPAYGMPAHHGCRCVPMRGMKCGSGSRATH